MLEKTILASAMYDRELIELLDPKWFSNQKYKLIVKALIKIGVSDVLAISKETNIPVDEIYEIGTDFETYSVVLNRIETLKKEYKKREILNILESAKNDIENVSLIDIGNRIDKVNFEDEENKKEDMQSIIIDLATELGEEPNKKHNDKYNFPIPSLNYYLYQIEKYWLMTIAAKSSKGKTAFSMQLATTFMKRGLKVLIISREMSQKALVKRMMLGDLDIEPNKLKSRDFTDNEMKNVNDLLLKHYSNFNSWIDTTSRTVNQITTQIKKYTPDVVFVDYIQLLKGRGKTREQEVASISGDLKAITLDFNIPIIVMAQLNDNMGYHRPKGDTPMRESKAIYHDSNVVIYIHEPIGSEAEKYSYTSDNEKKLMEIIIDKNRDGQTGIIPAYFIGKKLKFIEIEKK